MPRHVMYLVFGTIAKILLHEVARERPKDSQDIIMKLQGHLQLLVGAFNETEARLVQVVLLGLLEIGLADDISQLLGTFAYQVATMLT